MIGLLKEEEMGLLKEVEIGLLKDDEGAVSGLRNDDPGLLTYLFSVKK